jgi:hypothetical protein
LVAHHLDDEAALGLIWPVLHADFTAVDGTVSSQWIVESAFEDGEESFGVHATSESPIGAAIAGYTFIVDEELLGI